MLAEKTRNHILELQKLYPVKRSALIPALHLAQAEVGYLPEVVQKEVAELFEIEWNEVHAVITFYDMFFESPQGTHCLHVCKNISCMLRGADKLIETFCQKLQITPGETSSDGMFTLYSCECLGACDRAPVMLVEKKLIGPVDANDVDKILIEISQAAETTEDGHA